MKDEKEALLETAGPVAQERDPPRFGRRPIEEIP